ncbi:MAG: hypothetical protein QM831_20280 [Kofleriaceae bacterium]
MRLPVALMFLVGGACADHGNEGFFIVNNSAAVAGGTCTFTPDLTEPFIAAGSISVDSPSGYVMAPLFDSNITATDDQVNQRSIHLQGANVHAEVANGGTHQDYTVLFSGTIFPNGGLTNAVVEMLPASSIQAFGNVNAANNQNTEVVLTITAYGTLGGGRIDAEPFYYPITLVAPKNGLIRGIGYNSDGSINPTASQSCVGYSQVASPGNPCNAFQDGDVDCCFSPTLNEAVCPAVSE